MVSAGRVRRARRVIDETDLDVRDTTPIAAPSPWLVESSRTARPSETSKYFFYAHISGAQRRLITTWAVCVHAPRVCVSLESLARAARSRVRAKIQVVDAG